MDGGGRIASGTAIESNAWSSCRGFIFFTLKWGQIELAKTQCYKNQGQHDKQRAD